VTATDAPPSARADDEVQVWWMAVDEQSGDTLEQAASRVMSAQDRQRHERLRRADDRRRDLAARLLVRGMLGASLGLPAAELAFVAGAHGRPALAPSVPGAAGLSFNLSHTDRLVVMGLARGRELGVDVEDTRRSPPLQVARSQFAPAEVQALDALGANEQPRRFWELWTFKEAYVKARALGLGLGLDRVGIEWPGDGPARLRLDETLHDDAARWQLWQLQPDAHHLVALCVQARPGECLRLRCAAVTAAQGRLECGPASTVRRPAPGP